MSHPYDASKKYLVQIHGMKESETHQAIVEEGEVKARQDVLVELGQKLLGAPTERTTASVRGITDLDHLRKLNERLLENLHLG